MVCRSSYTEENCQERSEMNGAHHVYPLAPGMSEEDPLLSPETTRKRPTRKKRGPDGPLSWAVAFANFFINFLVVGLGRMSGILYVVFMHMFAADRKTASIPFSVQQATRNLFGPVVGILGQKYGVRIVTVGGGLLGAASAAACFYAEDINIVTLLWGLFFGICTALTTTLNQIPIDDYFERHRTTAGGLAFSGGCVGAFVFPVVLENLISLYGMNGTFLVMGGILLNVVPAAMILMPAPWKKKATAKNQKQPTQPQAQSKSYNTFHSGADHRDSQSANVNIANGNNLHGNNEGQTGTVSPVAGPFTENESHTAPLSYSEAVIHSTEYSNDGGTESQPCKQSKSTSGDSEAAQYEASDPPQLLPDTETAVFLSNQNQPSNNVAGSDGSNDLASESSPDSRCSSDKVINFVLLRKHSDLVYQLISLTIPFESSMSEFLSRTNHIFMDTTPLVSELEALYRFLSHCNNDTKSLSQTRKGAPESSSSSISRPTLGCGSYLTISRIEDDSRWYFLANKLKDLSSKMEKDILSYFPGEIHTTVKSLMKILGLLSDFIELKKEDERHKTQERLSTMAKRTENLNAEANELAKPNRRTGKRYHSSKSPGSNSLLDHLWTALLLHRKPLFLLICVCRAVFMLTFIPLVTVVVDFAFDQGLGRYSAKYVIAILSLGDLLGRLCLGWVNDTGWISLPRYMLGGMILLGASSATLPLMRSEVSLMPALLVFGALQGSLFVRHQVLVSHYMESHEQAIGMGFINLLSGILGFAIPYYIGYFRDTLGSYNKMFYVNAGICAGVGLLWMFEPLFPTSEKKTRLEKVLFPSNAPRTK